MRRLTAALLIIAGAATLALEADAPAAASATPPTIVRSWYGMSSWYGQHWEGRKTACGALFDPQQATVAHVTLPCGTVVRVTNARTGHWAFASVTDRGPYAEGREMDVSEAVARKVDLKKWGVEKVKIEIVRPAK